jgi:hypothetical protein
LKPINDKINFVYKSISYNKDASNVFDGYDSYHKIDSVYNIIDGELVKIKEIKHEVENMFLIYSKNIYSLYLEIAKLLKIACVTYQIDQEKQMYMIYAKPGTYNKNTSKSWYDFPGGNKPHLHGFYFPKVEQCAISFKNNDQIKNFDVSSGDLIINKATDLVNINTDVQIDIIEFYIVPLDFLKHNDPGVWCPI